MDSQLIGTLEADPALRVFAPERPAPDMAYEGLRCACGGTRFHLAGWPRIALGRGSFFWRAVTRVWREARMPMDADESMESPLWLPVFVRCDACGRNEVLLDGADVAGRIPEAMRGEPIEPVRCRLCRRGSVELVLGVARDAMSRDRVAVELRARCGACRRQSKVAWSDARPTDQEVRLDLLYGRR